MILSLPLLIAIYRKLEALGLLLGEVAAKRLNNPARETAVKTIVGSTIAAAGVIGLGLIILLLSSTLLPSGRTVIVLLLILAIITAFLWRTFIRVYSRAQFVLQETLVRPRRPAILKSLTLWPIFFPKLKSPGLA